MHENNEGKQELPVFQSAVDAQIGVTTSAIQTAERTGQRRSWAGTIRSTGTNLNSMWI